MPNALLTEAFGRIRGVVHSALKDASVDVLTYRADPGANTMAWLIWHLTRVQDDHVADLLDQEQVWTAQGWAARFDLPFDPDATGYGQSEAEVAAVRSGADLLGGYYDAVHARTLTFLGTVTEADLARIVDASWDPPVTLAVRLARHTANGWDNAAIPDDVRDIASLLNLSQTATLLLLEGI